MALRAKPERLVKPSLAGEVKPVAEPSSNTSVHLVISAFQDGARCARTMGWALEKAAAPHRVHFQVMQAAGDRDPLCADVFVRKQLKAFCAREADAASCERAVLSRSHFWTIPLEHAMGAAHQRGVLNELLEIDTADAFCLTTDSHMDFVHDWDTRTIVDWRATDNEFAVLTVYPPDISDSVEGSHVDLCGYDDNGDGIPRGHGGSGEPNQPGALPYLTMNWAAGSSFQRCHMDRNVPVDKHLHWIFDGEEINRAVRLWTHGYDLYLPSDTTILHDYSHAEQRFWNYEARSSKLQELHSRSRLLALLQLSEHVKDVDLGIYGLGTQRSLEQFVQWSRQSFHSKRWAAFLAERGLTPPPPGDHRFCKTLERVPVSDRDALAEAAVGGFHAYTPLGRHLRSGHDVSDPTHPQLVEPSALM